MQTRGVLLLDMADQPKQKTQPKGRDKRTGETAEPIEIPVPKRKDFDSLLGKAARAKNG